jgi:hypothetical protein
VLICALPRKHHADGFTDDFEIQPDVVVEDVPGVQVDPFLIRVRITAFTHLPDAGDAGFYGIIYTDVIIVIVAHAAAQQ